MTLWPGKWPVLLSLVLVAQTAQAADPLKRELAKRHYQLGETLYKTSDYKQALEEFKKAYQIEPHPALLYNIARCQEVMAQLEDAIEGYQKYLAKMPQAPNRLVVERRISNLRARLNEREREERQTAGESKRTGAGALTPTPPPPASQPGATEPALSPRASPLRRGLGWAGLGTGLALLATGVTFAGLAAGKAAEYEDAVQERRTYHELEEIDADGVTFNTVQAVTMVTGGILALVGAALLVWDLRESRRPAAASAGVKVNGRGMGLVGLVSF